MIMMQVLVEAVSDTMLVSCQTVLEPEWPRRIFEPAVCAIDGVRKLFRDHQFGWALV
jgi:hypothetical protein